MKWIMDQLNAFRIGIIKNNSIFKNYSIPMSMSIFKPFNLESAYLA